VLIPHHSLNSNAVNSSEPIILYSCRKCIEFCSFCNKDDVVDFVIRYCYKLQCIGIKSLFVYVIVILFYNEGFLTTTIFQPIIGSSIFQSHIVSKVFTLLRNSSLSTGFLRIYFCSIPGSAVTNSSAASRADINSILIFGLTALTL
jgi:hypothetical protein